MALFEVCPVDFIPNGVVREFTVGSEQTKILVFNENGKFFATSAMCTHMNEPLIKGSINGCRIRCPFHGACFSLKTGEIEDFPAWNSLNAYETDVRDGKIWVCLEPTDTPVVRQDVQPEKVTVVIGGGGAGFTAAQTLRENGYDGRVIIISSDRHYPYYRVKLSKQPDLPIEKVLLKSTTYYQKNNIEVITGKSVANVECSNSMLTMSDGTTLKFSTLLIATGCSPRKFPGSENLKGIHYMHTYDDANAIVTSCKERNAVVIGSGFTALEIAASTSKIAKKVTVISRDSVPIKRLVGDKIGEVFLRMHKKAGVDYICDSSVEKFENDNEGNITAVLLADGRRIPANACIIAIGDEPQTAFLKDSGIVIDDRGFIVTDELMRTNFQNIFAAGDVISFPVPLFLTGGVKRRDHFGHWPVAQMTGRVAAMNILGKKTVFNTVPFFWTTFYGTTLRVCGYEGISKPEEALIHGDLLAGKFIAYFLDPCKTRVTAVATLGMDPLAGSYAELITNGGQLYRKDIENDTEAKWASKYNIA